MTFDPNYNKKPWLSLVPAVTNIQTARAPDAYRTVCSQFKVEENPRYAPTRDVNGKLTTWCNIFVWDCTSALRCEIPHWYDDSGDPSVPGSQASLEMRANYFAQYLSGRAGKDRGWREVDAAGASTSASLGRPTVVVYTNPTGSGHVAMVFASPTGLRIAQAGAVCHNDVPLAVGFGQLPVRFFTHD